MHSLVADPHSDFAMFWPGSSPSEEGEHEGGAETINPYWVSDLQVNLLYFFFEMIINTEVLYMKMYIHALAQVSSCSSRSGNTDQIMYP